VNFESDQIEKNEMDGECRTHGERRRYTGFWWVNLRERDHLEDPGVDGKVILRRIFSKWDVGVWTGSSWLRWRAIVNAVMKLGVP
jgi:hypothetical protein